MNGNEVTKDGSEPFGYNFVIDGANGGKHTFKAVAEDEKGNKAESSITLIVGGY